MRLETSVFGTTFQNPVLLAAGTCGFGRELEEVLDLDALGGFVTKSVTVDSPIRDSIGPGPKSCRGSRITSIGPVFS